MKNGQCKKYSVPKSLKISCIFELFLYHTLVQLKKRRSSYFDIVNIGLHFFHKDVRLMLPLVVKHSIVAA